MDSRTPERRSPHADVLCAAGCRHRRDAARRAARNPFARTHPLRSSARPRAWDLPFEDDLACLIDLEPGAFDVVREIGLEERERAQCLRTDKRLGCLTQRSFSQSGENILKESEPIRVKGFARG